MSRLLCPLLLLCCAILSANSHRMEKRLLLLPRFLQMGPFGGGEQQSQGPPAERAATKRTRSDVSRPCYFSPVQCLLRTADQHLAFQNHPKFNRFGAKTLRREEQQPRAVAVEAPDGEHAPEQVLPVQRQPAAARSGAKRLFGSWRMGLS